MASRLSDFEGGRDTRARGRVGEDAATRWLERRGYRIVARNVTTKAGEIDIVAEDGDTLCFVEVKARASDTYGPAIEAVTPAKMRRIARAASLFLASRSRWRGEPPACRFDVLGMDRRVDGWRFSLVRGAFDAPTSRRG